MAAVEESGVCSEKPLWRTNLFQVSAIIGWIGTVAFDVVVFFQFPSLGADLRWMWILYGAIPAAALFGAFWFLSRGREPRFGFWATTVGLCAALPFFAFLVATAIITPIAVIRTLFPAGEWTQHCQRDDGVAHCSIFRAENVGNRVVGVSVWLASNASPNTSVYYMGDKLDHVSIRFGRESAFSEIRCVLESGVWTCPFRSNAALIADDGPTAVWVKIERSGSSEVQKFGFLNMRKHVKNARKSMPDFRLQ